MAVKKGAKKKAAKPAKTKPKKSVKKTVKKAVRKAAARPRKIELASSRPSSAARRDTRGTRAR